MSLALNAQTLQGKVVRVADGDTITILDATNAQNKVRLNKIDAPEKSQAFGEVSRKHLASMVASKNVQVEWTKKDKYGRILGDITIGTTNVNLRMVQDGLAWHFKAFDNTKEFAQAEIEAREKKIGLWKDANPIPPWEFRKKSNR
jgi:endonuclease YncB( thermonuclease family)